MDDCVAIGTHGDKVFDGIDLVRLADFTQGNNVVDMDDFIGNVAVDFGQDDAAVCACVPWCARHASRACGSRSYVLTNTCPVAPST